MKQLIAIAGLLFSINCYSSTTGNDLQELITSENGYRNLSGFMFVQAVNDTLVFSRYMEIENAKEMKRRPNLQHHLCVPKQYIYAQPHDIVKNYLNAHPAERNQPAASLVIVALLEAWPCEDK